MGKANKIIRTACSAAILASGISSCVMPVSPDRGGNVNIEASIDVTPVTRAAVVGTSLPQTRTLRVSAWLQGQDGSGQFFAETPFDWNGTRWSSYRLWPFEGTLDLYALSTDGLTVSLSSLSESGATYTLPDNSSHQADLLYAAAHGQEYTEAVPMSFRHAFAALVFVAKCTEGYNESTNRGIEITGITVRDVRWSGTLSLSPAGELTTDLDSDASDVSLQGLSAFYKVPAQAIDNTQTATYFGIGGRGMFVPRQEKTPFTVFFNVYNGEEVKSMSQTYTPEEGFWEDGFKYVYVLKFDGTQLLVDTRQPIVFGSESSGLGIDGWSSGSGNEATVTFPGN